MQSELLLGLIAYTIATSITPGPNNLILLSSGANYGFRKTIPVLLGIVLGFSIMIIVVGLGVTQVFERFPAVKTIMVWASLAYTAYLAWRIGSSDTIGQAGKERLMSAAQAALFQWVNAKGWVMALTAITLFAPSNSFTSVMIVSLIFAMTGLPSVSIWSLAGVQLKKFLSTAQRLRYFNISMAILLMLSVLPILKV
jgi:threonine/homoserine/homoserine lactone efflux protein